jgi:uncharacterized protein with GYD domain
VPDSTTITAMSLAINASGLVRIQTIPLLTADEVDAALKKTPSYRGPGQ